VFQNGIEIDCGVSSVSFRALRSYIFPVIAGKYKRERKEEYFLNYPLELYNKKVFLIYKKC